MRDLGERSTKRTGVIKKINRHQRMLGLSWFEHTTDDKDILRKSRRKCYRGRSGTKGHMKHMWYQDERGKKAQLILRIPRTVVVSGM